MSRGPWARPLLSPAEEGNALLEHGAHLQPGQQLAQLLRGSQVGHALQLATQPCPAGSDKERSRSISLQTKREVMPFTPNKSLSLRDPNLEKHDQKRAKIPWYTPANSGLTRTTAVRLRTPGLRFEPAYSGSVRRHIASQLPTRQTSVYYSKLVMGQNFFRNGGFGKFRKYG